MWREEAERLRAEVAALTEKLLAYGAELEKLKRHVFGKRSEKMPSVRDELRRSGKKSTPEAALATRRANAEKKAEAPVREIRHTVPVSKRVCPKCGGKELRPLGDGKKTELFEFVAPSFEKQVHIQETLTCRCGEGIVTAEATKAVEKGRYGPGFIAQLVTAKCGDSIPIYRLAKSYRRFGIPIARATMNDLFHAAAESLAPLSARLVELVAAEEVVRADETPIRVQAEKKTRKGYIWTFRTEKLIAYRYSASRSGETPRDVLGGTKGFLVVDGYTGYNQVVLPDGRERVGCWSHVRRKFFDAQSTAPEAKEILELIIELYGAEHEARDLGSEKHLELRKTRSAATVETIRVWLDAQQPRQLPKSPIGQAIGYAKGQWTALTRFLGDARLPLDNNASESALRPVALGRKNYLFVGHDEAGENIAGLYSLVATCEVNGVNPQAYLADVLLRAGSHPATRIDELLPHLWTPKATDPPAAEVETSTAETSARATRAATARSVAPTA